MIVSISSRTASPSVILPAVAGSMTEGVKQIPQAAAQKTVPEQYEMAIEKIGFYPIVRAGLSRLTS